MESGIRRILRQGRIPDHHGLLEPGGDLRFLLREIARLRRILREIVELRIASIEIDEEFPVPLDRGEVGIVLVRLPVAETGTIGGTAVEDRRPAALRRFSEDRVGEILAIRNGPLGKGVLVRV